MSRETVFAITTLAVWAGWALALRAAYLAFRLLGRDPGLDRQRTKFGVFLSVGLAALAFVLTATQATGKTVGESGALHLPLVWFVMPFSAWAAVFSCVFGVVRLVQGWLALGTVERAGRRKAGALWLVASVLLFWLFKSSGDKVQILRGTIPMSPGLAICLIVLLFSCVGAIAFTGREAKRRGVAKGIATHLALIAGSVVFGIPFAWLLITSFKEDRDMASTTGIVWVPKVQQMVPYLDPQDPLVETEFQGTTVQGTIIERLSDGGLKLEILKPGALRSLTCFTAKGKYRIVPKDIPLVEGKFQGKPVRGKVVKDLDDGRKVVEVVSPQELAGKRFTAGPNEVEPYRTVGLKFQNYPDSLEFLPPETQKGLVYLRNTLLLVVLNVIGTLLSSSLVAYAFARLRFPGKNVLFIVLLSTMMLPAAVTLLPQFLIYTSLGWVDTLKPLWVPAFLGAAFNIFLLRQFFLTIPFELEDAAKIDGCSYLRTYWQVMMPQVKPALAVVAIWTFKGTWDNFMGPLVYINSPENMPVSYALQLFQGERSGEPGLLMAFATMSMLPVLLVFFFAQKYFIEGVTLSGLGGR